MPPIKFSVTISLAISFIFLLITFWIFYTYSWSAAAAKEALSTTGSYYGAAATLGAAVIAAYLFVDWRDEKNFDLENLHLTNIVLGLRDIHAELIEMQSCSEKIKSTNNRLISYSNYINRARLDLQSAINKLKADVGIYSMLVNDKEPLFLLDGLEEFCKDFNSQYNQLIHRYYVDYINELYKYFNDNKKNIPDIKDKSSFERTYCENEKQILAPQIKSIEVFFHLHILDEVAISALGSHEKLKSFCIKKLRPQE